jgi:hypothetical protein
MIASNKYPIFPKKVTRWRLAEDLEACRWLYNRLLQELNEARDRGIKHKVRYAQNMTPSLRLMDPKHRSIRNASGSKFIFMPQNKAQNSDRRSIKADPKDAIQRCSDCGGIKKKDLSARSDECPYCGLFCDRDYNASMNLLTAGMEQPAVLIGPKLLSHLSVMQVSGMKWKAAPFRTW